MHAAADSSPIAMQNTDKLTFCILDLRGQKN